jgi:hypothetical protein
MGEPSGTNEMDSARSGARDLLHTYDKRVSPGYCLDRGTPNPANDYETMRIGGAPLPREAKSRAAGI